MFSISPRYSVIPVNILDDKLKYNLKIVETHQMMEC
jgi:hypothetical protein